MTQTEAGRGVLADPAVRIGLVDTEPEARAAVAALSQIWRSPDGQPPFPAELAWVLAHSGNYVAVARLGDEVVGAAIGFRGVDEAGPLLHSHIAGVVPRLQGSGVGYQLKEHQRSWALSAGLDRITWTFDPLVARNAYFNVVKLGAELTRYYVDFYGPMDDGVNTGDQTDRCLVTWRLDSPRAAAAARGSFETVDARTLIGAGADYVLAADADGGPALHTSTADCRLVQIPPDAVALRREHPAMAREWRLALRAALLGAFADGLEAGGVTRDGRYVLARPDA